MGIALCGVVSTKLPKSIKSVADVNTIVEHIVMVASFVKTQTAGKQAILAEGLCPVCLCPASLLAWGLRRVYFKFATQEGSFLDFSLI